MLTLSSAIVSIVGLFALVMIVLYWQFTQRSKEIALQQAKQLCKKHHVQLLDDSIAFTKIRFERRFNRLCLIKTFEFGYSNDINYRKTGQLQFYRDQLLHSTMDYHEIYPPTSEYTSNTTTKLNNNVIIDLAKHRQQYQARNTNETKSKSNNTKSNETD